jgi:aminoglycoside phosphotransferase (APT) family kinase protein
MFTCGDITPRNIMVGESAHVAGILDWEYANVKPSGDVDW